MSINSIVHYWGLLEIFGKIRWKKPECLCDGSVSLCSYTWKFSSLYSSLGNVECWPDICAEYERFIPANWAC